MLYPALKDTEYNEYYGAEEHFSYNEGFQSVEDTSITTSCAEASSTLYMYRDSFGNALVPFFATAYNRATFSKGFAVDLEKTFSETHPDTFIMELVERNLDWLITMPPFFATEPVTSYNPAVTKKDTLSFAVEDCTYSSDYKVLTMTLPKEADLSSDIYVVVKEAAGLKRAYEAFLVKEETGTLKACAYVKTENLETMTIDDSALWTKTDNTSIEYIHK